MSTTRTFVSLLLLVLLAGCAGTEALRREVDQLHAKQQALQAAQQELRAALAGFSEEMTAVEDRMDDKLAGRKREFDAAYKRLVGQVQDSSRQFTQSLEQSLDMNYRKTHREYLEQEKSMNAALQKLKADFETTTEALQKKLNELERRLAGTGGQAGKAASGEKTE